MPFYNAASNSAIRNCRTKSFFCLKCQKSIIAAAQRERAAVKEGGRQKWAHDDLLKKVAASDMPLAAMRHVLTKETRDLACILRFLSIVSSVKTVAAETFRRADPLCLSADQMGRSDRRGAAQEKAACRNKPLFLGKGGHVQTPVSSAAGKALEGKQYRSQFCSSHAAALDIFSATCSGRSSPGSSPSIV